MFTTPQPFALTPNTPGDKSRVKLRSSQIAVGVALAVWTFLLALGARVLLNYDLEAGKPATATADWPATSRIARQAGQFTLVMLAHPQCPCTRASLGELERLTAASDGRLNVAVVFRMPTALRPEVEASDLWKRASAMPGVDVSFDAQGGETDAFGAYVSGQTLLYDPQGKLVFSGGITAARGHEGANRGADSILALVRGETHADAKTPVFGCSLNDPERADPERGLIP